MAGHGIPQPEIAEAVGIDPKTLRKYYAKELRGATTIANARVAESLFKQATDGNTAAAIFWLKARAGWREKVDVEHAGGVEIKVVFGDDCSAGLASGPGDD